MAIPIIHRSKLVETISYTLSFEYDDMPGAGFGFDCDENGTVDESKLAPVGMLSFLGCRSGTVDGRPVHPCGILKYTNRYREPAVGRCLCGAKVALGEFTNTCDRCERDYNWNGDLLAPREQWGEETGENPCDCVGPFEDSDTWGA